ncbi:MAG: cytochrome P450 [Alphaproteobacteria bacterium]|nr:cytochrome P450 [Alphaproteobacteria bacterium]
MTAPPPCAGGLPFIGVLPSIAKTPLATFSAVAETHGPLVALGRTFLPGKGIEMMHLANEPELAEFLLKTGRQHYDKSYVLLQKVLGNGLLTSEGEFWKRQRRLAQPAFRRKRVEGMFGLMRDEGDALLARWAARAPGERFDLAVDMTAVTLEIAVRTMFSTTLGEVAERVGHLLATALTEIDRRVWETITLPDWVPTRRNRDLRDAIAGLHALVEPIIAARRQDPGDHDDLLSMLMDAVDEETGESMSDAQLRDEVLTIFLAGHETTAATLTWAWWLLDTHPAALARLQAEVDAVLVGPPTLETVQQLPFTRAVVQESLRLYPPAWILARTAVEDHDLGGRRIHTDEVVFTLPYLLHRHPGWWDEPEAFRPERFLEAGVPRHPFAYIPFGGGPRVCIGSHMAMLEGTLLLAMMAREWAVHVDPAHEVVPMPTITMRPRDGMPVTLERRVRS